MLLKKWIWWIGLLALINNPLAAFAYDRADRLEALESFDVKKNMYRLLRTNSCPGCYLVNAKLSKMDLRQADLKNANLIGATFRRATLVGARLDGAKIAGADFSRAIWIDGSLCLDGSIGGCIKNQPE